MRTAFTMIELIFVIVILGVLAVIAVPKLAATRDDARNVKLAQNVHVAASEIASYAVANGNTTVDMSLMSNAIDYMLGSGQATDEGNKTIYIKRKTIDDCIIVSITSGVNDENLTITGGNPGTDPQCQHLQALIDFTKYPMKIRGATVAQ